MSIRLIATASITSGASRVRSNRSKKNSAGSLPVLEALQSVGLSRPLRTRHQKSTE